MNKSGELINEEISKWQNELRKNLFFSSLKVYEKMKLNG